MDKQSDMLEVQAQSMCYPGCYRIEENELDFSPIGGINKLLFRKFKYTSLSVRAGPVDPKMYDDSESRIEHSEDLYLYFGFTNRWILYNRVQIIYLNNYSYILFFNTHATAVDFLIKSRENIPNFLVTLLDKNYKIIEVI